MFRHAIPVRTRAGSLRLRWLITRWRMVFVSTTRGIGYGNSFGNLDYNAALSYRAGRKDRDVSSDSIASGSDDLRGMGDIKGSAIVVRGWGTG